MPEDALLEMPEVETPDAPEVETPDEPEVLEDAPEVEGEEAPEAAEEIEEEEAEEGQAEPVTADGRKMPDSLKKAIAGIKATNPEAAKLIKGMFFADQEYRAVFPKPADAAAAKGLIDQIGGPEGIQSIQAERDEWAALDKSYAEGSGDFVKTIAESNPDAFVKIAPQAINEWANRAPEQYGYYANTVALNTLKSAGISTDVLAAAYQRYADKPEVQAVIAEVHNALAGLQQKTAQFEQKRTDPREEALKQKETQFEQKRRADFETGVANQAETYLKEKMQPEIDRVLAGRKVDPEAAEMMQGLVNQEIQKRLAEIPNFENQLEAFYRTGDAQKSAEYIKTQYNRILPEAVKKVITPLYRNIAPAQVKKTAISTGKGAASPGEVILREMPDRSDVDWTKTTMPDMIEGRAILKNGKKATGWA